MVQQLQSQEQKVIRSFSSIEEIADSFDAFIVDLWGVIHDGQQRYPGVVRTLEYLKSRDKNVLFLSNAPRRAQKAIDGLNRFGIGKDLYAAVLTSGEATHMHIEKNNIGQSYYYIGPPKDEDLLDDLQVRRVEDAKSADFAIVTGYDSDRSPLDEKRKDIEVCLDAGLPLICVNPDREVVRQNGVRVPCAGIIADQYEQAGGKVSYFGKPYPAVYELSQGLLGVSDKADVAALGDSLSTDIKGANDMGIFSVLVTGGIMAERLKIKPGEIADTNLILETCQGSGVLPDACMPAFRLGK